MGIYVTGFNKQSIAEEAGVRIGDRLLQVYNSLRLSSLIKKLCEFNITFAKRFIIIKG